jgi:hypothetical protein
MTVPPLFGWETIATVVVLVVVVAIAAVVILQAGRDASGQSEWQAWLDGRSATGRPKAADADDDRAHAPGGSFRGGPAVVVRHRAAWRSPRS